jgi:hypothetical protein
MANSMPHVDADVDVTASGPRRQVPLAASRTVPATTIWIKNYQQNCFGTVAAEQQKRSSTFFCADQFD